MIDEVGNKYGKLTVIRQAENRRYGCVAWLCKCECGNECIVSGRELRTGDTQSCGCIKSRGEQVISKILQENNIYFEKEKIFKDCRYPDSGGYPRFDFYVNNTYLIEYDGEQHFNKDNP